ncbi:MAG: hypothetical protein M3Y62_07075 [Candidatus Dormibacteraeota bacterium]|nr:hypothetical protein [Candidatus Dormibacteraeota bacterium]
MAGTSWDKQGQLEQAFEIVAPAIRRSAQKHSLRLQEYFRDDPVWRLSRGESSVDVAWDEAEPEQYAVSALWWEGDKLQRHEAGVFTRDRSLDELEALVSEAAARLPQ